jgi:hypothetical protein
MRFYPAKDPKRRRDFCLRASATIFSRNCGWGRKNDRDKTFETHGDDKLRKAHKNCLHSLNFRAHFLRHAKTLIIQKVEREHEQANAAERGANKALRWGKERKTQWVMEWSGGANGSSLPFSSLRDLEAGWKRCLGRFQFSNCLDKKWRSKFNHALFHGFDRFSFSYFRFGFHSENRVEILAVTFQVQPPEVKSWGASDEISCFHSMESLDQISLEGSRLPFIHAILIGHPRKNCEGQSSLIISK